MSIQSIKDKSQGIIAKFIVGLIVLTFALFGVDAIIGNSGSSQTAATVNGEEISELELLRASEFFKRQLLAEMGANADPAMLDEALVRSQALDALIDRQLMLQMAQDQGLAVSEQRVNQTILDTEAFQSEGVFDRAVYEYRLRNMQMTPLDYKNQLTRDLLIQQTRAGLAGSAFVTDTEVRQLARLDRQRRDLSYLRVEADELAADIVISDDQAQTYYRANQADYMTEEALNIEYLELKQSDFAADIDVSEAELKARYMQEKAALSQRGERRAAHILISTEERSAGEAAALVEQIQAQLAEGASFAELAKAYSDDPVSAAQGGDLGFAEQGAYVPEFEEVLFSLSKDEVSEVVDTEFGLHLIKLLDVRTPEVPAFSEMREQLAEDLRFQKAEEAFVAAAEQLQNDSFSAGDLHEPAQNLGLTIKISDFFTRDAGAGIASHPQVRRIAFSDEVLTEGNNSDLIELEPDHVVVIRSKQHKPSKLKPYESVAQEIKSLLTARAAQRDAQQLGEQMLVELRDGKTLTAVSEDYGYSLQTQEQVKRNESGLDAEINRHLFVMPKPANDEPSYDGLVLPSGDFVVMALTKVTEGSAEQITDQELDLLARYLGQQSGYEALREFKQGVYAEAEIEKR